MIKILFPPAPLDSRVFNSELTALVHLKDLLNYYFSVLFDNMFRSMSVQYIVLGCFESVEYIILFVCSNAVAGESALDRMACGLGGKLVLPMIKEHIMQMLQNRKLCLF